MTDDEIKNIQKKVRYSLRKFSGNDYGWEDVSQEVITRRLEGKGKHQTVDQTVIDISRSRVGRKGSPGYNERIKIAAAKTLEPKAAKKLIAPADDFRLSDRISVEQMFSCFKGNDRVILILHYKYGYDQVEIAYLYGVTKQYINEKLRLLENRLRRKVDGKKQ